MEDNSSFDDEENDKRLNELMGEIMAMKKNVVTELSPIIRHRVAALKNLQKETLHVEAELQRNLFIMEKNFQSKHEEVYKKRAEIVMGLHEPSEGDEIVPSEGHAEPKGIPNFWLSVLKNVSMIRPLIQDHDEEILKHLIDVRSLTQLTPSFSFQLEFHFEPNEFFQNAVLTKTYLMKCEVDENDPFTFDGPEIYKATGCEIMWNEGKNVTLNSQLNSFFNFFNPPQLGVENATRENEKIEEFMENDFKIGYYLKELVIPCAVLYFTAEIDDFIPNDEFDLDDSDSDDTECDF